jgi:hypothetical protein
MRSQTIAGSDEQLFKFYENDKTCIKGMPKKHAPKASLAIEKIA